MSLITRCPACGTMFNVVADQLKVSQGWVRCGQCAEVFDATLHLRQAGQQEPQTGVIYQPEPLVSTLTVSDTGYSSYAEEVTAVLTAPDERPEPVFSESLASLPPHAPESMPVDRQDALPGGMPEDVSNDVSFVRDARRQAFWRKPLVRFVSGLAALLLAGLLVLQVVMMQRDSLAALEPRLKPLLQMLCERLACHVGPVRQIESIVIDSSSFNKTNDAGIYRLNFSLKNTGAAPVAMPSLEVTLTDIQDQVVLRRVLSPSQFSAANAMLLAKADFSSGLNLQVVTSSTPADPLTAANAPLRVAGYRLLAFYP
jgi:predicted Zn finger-like uncharacterized protein